MRAAPGALHAIDELGDKVRILTKILGDKPDDNGSVETYLAATEDRARGALADLFDQLIVTDGFHGFFCIRVSPR